MFLKTDGPTRKFYLDFCLVLFCFLDSFDVSHFKWVNILIICSLTPFSKAHYFKHLELIITRKYTENFDSFDSFIDIRDPVTTLSLYGRVLY